MHFLSRKHNFQIRYVFDTTIEILRFSSQYNMHMRRNSDTKFTRIYYYVHILEHFYVGKKTIFPHCYYYFFSLVKTSSPYGDIRLAFRRSGSGIYTKTFRKKHISSPRAVSREYECILECVRMMVIGIPRAW